MHTVLTHPRRPLLLLPLALAVLASCQDGELPTAPALAPDAPRFTMQLPATPPGTLVSWGRNDWGQVGGTPAGSDFVTVAAGFSHSVALRADGTLVSWGRDGHNQVGHTPAGSGFAAVAANGNYSVALRANGSLDSWGDDFSNQVGHTPAGSDFVAVAAGSFHGVALRSDGSLVSWGDNSFNQVGGTPTGSGFAAIAAGIYHSVALRADGSLISWGRDHGNQVGGTPAGSDFVAVAAGGHGSVVLRANGFLVSWGTNSSNTPEGSGFAAVAAGGAHRLALRSDGSLVSWGNNTYNQVGGTPAESDFVAVAAGSNHSVAIQVEPPADDTPPAITITTPADGAVYRLNEVVLADYACEDEAGGSGLASCEGTVAHGTAIHTATVGTKSFTVAATDNAGNSTNAQATYSVVYDFVGFSAPVSNGGVLNVAKAGQTIAVKWRLLDAGGNPLTSLTAATITVAHLVCEVGAPTDPVEGTAAGGSGLQNLGDGYYQLNWQTSKNFANSCKTMHLDLGDGTTRTALFRFNR